LENKIILNAHEIFNNDNKMCAEAVVTAVRNHLAPDMPKEYISAASGFSMGVGGAGCLCGVVSGGVMCLGYFFGRDFPTTITDPDSQKTITLSYQLQEAFKNQFGTLCCHKSKKSNCADYIGFVIKTISTLIAQEMEKK